jgi:F-type H+-transporting ATPase subunit b
LGRTHSGPAWLPDVPRPLGVGFYNELKVQFSVCSSVLLFELCINEPAAFRVLRAVNVEGGSKMIEINYTLFIQMANFLIFLVLMNFVLYRPIRRVVAERKKLISGKQEEIESLETQARAALQEYDKMLQQSRNTGFQKIQELKAAGYEQEKELLHDISEKAAAKVREVREKIKEEIGTARTELKQQVKAFSADLAQKILGRKI